MNEYMHSHTWERVRSMSWCEVHRVDMYVYVPMCEYMCPFTLWTVHHPWVLTRSDAHSYVVWHCHICDTAHSCVTSLLHTWHDSSIRDTTPSHCTWLMQTCYEYDAQHVCMWIYDSYVPLSRRLCKRAMTRIQMIDMCLFRTDCEDWCLFVANNFSRICRAFLWR